MDHLFSPVAELAVVGAMLIDEDALTRMASTLTEDMFFEHKPFRVGFRAMKRLWAEGKKVDPVTLAESLKQHNELEEVGGLQFIASLLDAIPTAAQVEHYAQIVKDYAARRELVRVGEGIAAAAAELKHSPTKVIDRALNRITGIIARTGTYRGPLTQEEFMADELARMDMEGNSGIRLPYDKFRQQVGDLIPGDTVAIPGYSNQGKTLLFANLARFWTLQGYAQDWYPTESGGRFLSRIVSSHARVKQFYAERDAWHLASEEEREAYQMALRDITSFNCWNLIPNSRITPEEIIATTTMRRRKRKDGEIVIVGIDHMHRLNYGGINPAFAVADTTQRLRDWAKESTGKGDPTILVMLFQPKKPPVDIQMYRPVGGYDISGSGQVMAELDIIMSPYRRWVKTEAGLYTPWGTDRCLMREGKPVFARPEAEGAKVDDQHMYVKWAKRRTGGEGPTTMLNIESPSGYIYQLGEHQPSEMGGMVA